MDQLLHAMVWSQHEEELWAFWGHHLQYCILIVLASLVNSDMIRLFLRNVLNMGGVDRSCDQRFCDGQSLEPMLFDFTYVVDQGDSFVQTSMLQQRGLLSCLKLQACDCNFRQLCADLEQHLHRCNLRLFLILIMVHDYAVHEVLYVSVCSILDAQMYFILYGSRQIGLRFISLYDKFHVLHACIVS